ncbi:hypothetical protein SAMN02745127_02995 [Oceanospirillum multiglobuliferum]|nr:hypothetical protein [Oceanospirillum multiglobuliferum]SKA26685.1 hypothetical protein SAMN02745127_02995 [Oceanospirillum multiglobuliferum]
MELDKWAIRSLSIEYQTQKLKAVLKTYQVVDKHGKAQLQMDNHLYNYLVIITYMMKSIQPSTSWPARLVEHILALTVQQQQAMGFPVNWIESLFWKDFSASK